MAEETQTTETVEEVEQEQVDTQESTEQPKEKIFTETEVQKLIKDRLAREQKAKEKAVEEAEKLAKMNAEQKKEYEYEKMQEELAELKKERAFYSLSKEASKMLAEYDIPTDDEVFEVVVKENAEDTKEKVEWFAGLVNKLVEKGVKQALSGKSPKTNNTTSQVVNPFAKETFNLTEQGKLLKENPDLYNTLKDQANK